MTTGAGARLLSLGAGLVTTSVAARSLGDSSFGALATLATVVSLTGFADLGLGLGLMTRLAHSHGKDDSVSVRPLVSSALALLLAIGLTVAIIGSTLSFVLPWDSLLGRPDVHRGELTASLLLFSLSIGAGIPASLGQRILLGTQQGARANSWNMASSGAQLLSTIVVATLHLGLTAFVLSIVTMPVCIAGIQTTFVLVKDRDLSPRFREASRSATMQLFGLGGLFLILNISVAAAYQSDTLVVSAVLGASAAGAFAVALRMFNAFTGLLSMSLQQFWPALTEALSRGDHAWASRRFKQVLLISASGLTAMSVVLIFFGRPLIGLWVGPTLVPSLNLLITLATWTVYAQVMSQCSIFLNAAGIVKPQIAFAVVMALVNVPLSIVFTRSIGISGPLLGSLVAHIICNGIPVIILVRRALRQTSPRMATSFG